MNFNFLHEIWTNPQNQYLIKISDLIFLVRVPSKIIFDKPLKDWRKISMGEAVLYNKLQLENYIGLNTDQLISIKIEDVDEFHKVNSVEKFMKASRALNSNIFSEYINIEE